jgi:hypothetical protein
MEGEYPSVFYNPQAKTEIHSSPLFLMVILILLTLILKVRDTICYGLNMKFPPHPNPQSSCALLKAWATEGDNIKK